MAECWPSSFFCVFMDLDFVFSKDGFHLYRTSLVNKGFVTWDKTPKLNEFSLRDKARIRARCLARSGSQSQRAFGSSCRSRS